MNKICCGFGHRELLIDIKNELEETVEELIVYHGINRFMTGGMGDFDNLFASAVRGAKGRHPEIHLLLVKPYFTADLNTNKFYFEKMYDTVLIPDELSTAHYKTAIPQRNRWMIDHSALVITCVYRNFGGAYTAMQYAEKQQKLYKNLARESFATTFLV